MDKNNGYISRKGYTIYKNSLSDSEKNKIESDLKITPYDNTYNVFKNEYVIYLQNPAKYYSQKFFYLTIPLAAQIKLITVEICSLMAVHFYLG